MWGVSRWPGLSNTRPNCFSTQLFFRSSSKGQVLGEGLCTAGTLLLTKHSISSDVSLIVRLLNGRRLLLGLLLKAVKRFCLSLENNKKKVFEDSNGSLKFERLGLLRNGRKGIYSASPLDN